MFKFFDKTVAKVEAKIIKAVKELEAIVDAKIARVEANNKLIAHLVDDNADHLTTAETAKALVGNLKAVSVPAPTATVEAPTAEAPPVEKL